MPMPCRTCSSENPDGALFCVRCGVPLTAPGATSPSPVTEGAAPGWDQAQTLVRRCERCHTSNDGGALFCHHCGWNLAASTPSAPGQLRPAGFWLRLGAYLLDVVLLGIVVGIGAGAALAAGAISAGDPTWTNIAAQLGTLAYFTITVGLKGASGGKWLTGLRIVRMDGSRVSIARSFFRYLALSFVFLPMTAGALMVSGAQAADSDLMELSRGVFTDSLVLAIAGALVFTVGVVVVLVFAVWLAVSEHKRGWHDLIAGTRVVRVR